MGYGKVRLDSGKSPRRICSVFVGTSPYHIFLDYPTMFLVTTNSYVQLCFIFLHLSAIRSCPLLASANFVTHIPLRSEIEYSYGPTSSILLVAREPIYASA